MKFNEWMSPRTRLLLFSTIQLLRETLKPQFSDWKDADDYIFSKLDFTRTELKQIFKNRGTLYHDASAVDDSNWKDDKNNRVPLSERIESGKEKVREADKNKGEPDKQKNKKKGVDIDG